jgi:hypothetical protein
MTTLSEYRKHLNSRIEMPSYASMLRNFKKNQEPFFFNKLFSPNGNELFYGHLHGWNMKIGFFSEGTWNPVTIKKDDLRGLTQMRRKAIRQIVSITNLWK